MKNATGFYCEGCGLTIGTPGMCPACKAVTDDIRSIPDEMFLGMPVRYPWG